MTSNVVTITLYYIFKHPEIFANVKEEVDREFADPSKIDIEDLNRMTYVNATLKESMRYADPIGGLFYRVAVKDKFTPERWLGDSEYINNELMNEPFAFLPFSAGPRMCIGQNLALIESKIILSLFIQTFEFRFSKDYKLIRKQTASFRPKDPLIADLTVKSKIIFIPFQLQIQFNTLSQTTIRYLSLIKSNS